MINLVVYILLFSMYFFTYTYFLHINMHVFRIYSANYVLACIFFTKLGLTNLRYIAGIH
jgi:hypothetical protein